MGNSTSAEQHARAGKPRDSRAQSQESSSSHSSNDKPSAVAALQSLNTRLRSGTDTSARSSPSHSPTVGHGKVSFEDAFSKRMDLGGNAGGFGGGYPSDWMNMMRGSALAGSAVTEDVHGMILPPDSRRASYVSSTVDDDDDTSIDANLQEDGNTVPTFIKWSGSRAHKVSVIGTFNNWRINIPLTKSVHDFSTVIHLPPGAHRLKFLVDDEWKLSNELQTATDSSGNLLNYIEVTQKDLNAVRNAGKQPSDQLHKPRRPRKEKYTSDIPAFFQEAFDASQRAAAEADASPEPSSPPATTTTHTESISQGSPSSSHSSITSEQDADPTPPSLPPHLEKVILNTNSYLKEDASVLPNPNHVVLNHLAASSIKNNVLATSATVRYHRKYVTTILYKPVELPAMD